MSITQTEARAVLLAFAQYYPGARDLLYRLGESTAEIYGPLAEKLPVTLKGAYHPQTCEYKGHSYHGRVVVALENADGAADLTATLRHEVLGHYGANTFTPAEKRALLDGLIAAREQPVLKSRWEDINRRYADKSMDVRAEEVWAQHCETLLPNQHMGLPHVRERGEQSFMETCVARVRPMQVSDLHNIVCMVAQGLHDRSRTQQNFPKINVQFRGDEVIEQKKPFHEMAVEKLSKQDISQQTRVALAAEVFRHQEFPEKAVEQFPELAPAYAYVRACEAKTQADGVDEKSRAIVMALVRENVAKRIENGDIPNVEIREERRVEAKQRREQER